VLVLIGHVGTHKAGPIANVGGQLLAGLLVHVGDKNIGPFLG
jgi:hypothetical protein